MKRLILAAILALSTLSIAAVTPNMLLVNRSLKSVVHLTGTSHTVTTLEQTIQVTMIIEKATQEGGPARYGCSAFSIAPRKFLTAAHCMGDDMMIDGHKAFMVAQDVALDLAVIVSDYEKPALTLRTRPLVLQEETVSLGYGYSWKFPTIMHHLVMITNFSPYPEIAPGTWFSTAFIGGMSGGVVVDMNGQIVGVVQRGDYQVGYGVNSATIFKFRQSTVVILD